MTSSDKIALGALIISAISLLGVPLSAYLSYRYGVRLFRHETEETRITQLYEAKARLDHDLALYGALVHTFAKELGMASTTTDGKHFAVTAKIADPETFFTRVFNTGIHDQIVRDVERLRELGMDVFLAHHDPLVHESLAVFSLEQKDLTPPKKAESIGRLFLENGVQGRLAAISRNDLRSFSASH